MKKINFIIILFTSISLNTLGQSPANDPAWVSTPKFFDDFNNLNGWWPETTSPWFNTMFGFYANRGNINNTIITGNVLELSAVQPINDPFVAIHSGYYSSNDKHTYGYYEASINFATPGDSYMPAFWLFDASSCNCPSCPGFYDEIDIEIFSHSSGPFDLTSTTHYARPAVCPMKSDHEEYTPNPGLQNAFHTYGIEWMPGHVVIYYDNVPVRIKLDDFIPTNDMRIVFSLGFRTPIIDNVADNSFPGYMYVDYIKALDIKMTDCASTDVTFSSAFNSGSYDYKVKHDITFNNGNSTNLTSGIITLRASNSTEINGDFTVNGADFTILPTKCY